MSVHAHKVLIREQHLDTLGHMNSAAYHVLAEEARWQMLYESGFTLEMVKKSGHAPVILRSATDYFREILLREEIVISSQVIEYVGKTGKMTQAFIKGDGSIAAEITLTVGLMDLKSRKLLLPTPLWNKALGLAN